MTPLVVLSLAPILAGGLVAFLAGPGSLPFAVLVALLFVSGLGASWLIPLNVSFVQAVPSASAAARSAWRSAGSTASRASAPSVAGLGRGGAAAQRRRRAVRRPGPDRRASPSLIAFRRTQGHMAAADPAEGPSTA